MLDLKPTMHWSAMVLAAAALAGCSGSVADPTGEDFVSDNPYGEGGQNGGESDSDGTTDPTGGDSGGDEGGGDDGSREVAEADIVHIEGDRLYALSRFGGLTVIDVSTPDQLPVLGRFRANAEPFEMYVDGGQVFIMYQNWGEYALDEDTDAYVWQTSSRLIALDASNPADISLEGDFTIPGEVSDSRRVGEVLYVVTKENEWCWNCEEQGNATVVTSLDVSDETQVEIVDQLRLEDDAQWSGRRSVSATDERLYIAGPDWGSDQDDGSTIEVIDISDPGGTLVKGASVDVVGRIESRWQMDEYEDVLRVISQPPQWGSNEPPRIETFSVIAADDIVPLGNLDMTLPRPEELQSVRFDGPHAYAITFEQTDPLFTLDLSDPENPLQVGELEIPGFVYHMETRGDRVLGIGFDRGNPEGSINASLFDVSDFANPTMIERVHFGGDWASFGEDQDRIHKSFQVLDDLGLLLIPFTGWVYDDDEEYSCGEYRSGIQLVDWVDDTLALRGVAPMHGGARRALIHDDRMLGVSDLSVESFDIADRDAPSKTAELALAARANQIALGDGIVVRLAADWWTAETRLEVVDASDPEDPTALGRMSLDTIIPDGPEGPEFAEWGCAHYSYYDAEMFVHEGFVYLVRQSNLWDYGEDGRTAIDVVDIRDPMAPAYVETLEFEGHRGWSYGRSLTNDERAAHILGDALVLVTNRQDWEEDGPGTSTSTFEVVDLSEPGHPTHAQSIPRPAGLGHGGLQSFDGVGVSWHMRPVDGEPDKVRFFLDRLNVPSAENANLAEPVNVPGAVLAYDEESQRAVVADFQLEVLDDDEECWSHPGSWYNYYTDTCGIAHRPLHLVQLHNNGASLVDTASLEGDDGAVRGAAASDERLFVHVQRGDYEWNDDEYGGPTAVPQAEVAVFADWTTGDLAPEGISTLPDGNNWLSQLTAVGTRLVFRADNGLGEVDATDAAAPSLEIHELWGYYCSDLETDGQTALCAMGQWGVQAVELE